MFLITPTKEQECIKNDSLNYPISVVNAFAGTGKTSTLILLTKHHKERKFLYLAYNKSVEMEAKEKFGTVGNTKVQTTHALAYKYVSKFTNINLRNITNLKVKELAERYNIDYGLASLVRNTFQQYCNSGKMNVHANPQIKRVVETIFKDIEDGVIPPTFDFILKKFHLLLLDRQIAIKEDVILLDEGQDTNDVTLAIFHLIEANNKVIVGDKHQQIYAFRGSKNALGKIKGKQFYLTESFRFNETIADNANKLLAIFKNESVPIISKQDNYEEFKKALGNQQNTLGYISRSNTTLVGKMLELIDDNIPFITVREPDNIFRLILDVGYICSNKNSKVSFQNKYLKSLNLYITKVTRFQFHSMITRV